MSNKDYLIIYSVLKFRKWLWEKGRKQCICLIALTVFTAFSQTTQQRGRKKCEIGEMGRRKRIGERLTGGEAGKCMLEKKLVSFSIYLLEMLLQFYYLQRRDVIRPWEWASFNHCGQLRKSSTQHKRSLRSLYSYLFYSPSYSILPHTFQSLLLDFTLHPFPYISYFLNLFQSLPFYHYSSDLPLRKQQFLLINSCQSSRW